MIAELIETLSGRPYADVINERVAATAGAAPVSAPRPSRRAVPP